MSKWALGLSFVPVCGLSLIGGILAIVVLVQSRDGIDRGRKRAKIALIVAIAWFVLGIVLVVCVYLFGSHFTDDDADHEPGTSRGDVSVLDLKVGDCLPNVAKGAQDTVRLVPCSEPHRVEVYADFRLRVQKWPGRREIERLSGGGCTKRAPAFSRTPAGRRQTDVIYIYPTTPRSLTVDDGVTCVLVAKKPVTGSLDD